MKRQNGVHRHARPGPEIGTGSVHLEEAARLFRALGDAQRLQILETLSKKERCVGELVDLFGHNFSTVSQRLKLLRLEGLVVRRREGKHLYYGLIDDHLTELIRAAVEHSGESRAPA